MGFNKLVVRSTLNPVGKEIIPQGYRRRDLVYPDVVGYPESQRSVTVERKGVLRGLLSTVGLGLTGHGLFKQESERGFLIFRRLPVQGGDLVGGTTSVDITGPWWVESTPITLSPSGRKGTIESKTCKRSKRSFQVKKGSDTIQHFKLVRNHVLRLP